VEVYRIYCAHGRRRPRCGSGRDEGHVDGSHRLCMKLPNYCLIFLYFSLLEVVWNGFSTSMAFLSCLAGVCSLALLKYFNSDAQQIFVWVLGCETKPRWDKSRVQPPSPARQSFNLNVEAQSLSTPHELQRADPIPDQLPIRIYLLQPQPQPSITPPHTYLEGT
jgi:hypothetical protein